MKNLIIKITLLLCITSCGHFPSASEGWRNSQGVKIPPALISKEMKYCGFINTWNPIDMPKNDLIRAAQCMENKGYFFNGKRTCDKNAYKDYPACK